MGLTLELPPPLSDDLIRDAANDHVTPEEHVQIVLSLVQALRRDHPEKAFLKSFRAYLVARSLDAETVLSAFDDVVALLLRNHCSPTSIDENYEAIVSDLPPLETLVQQTGRSGRRSALGSCAHLNLSSEDFAREKQEEIAREERGWE